MKKAIKLLSVMLLVLVFICLVGCKKEDEPKAPVTITDMVGRSVEVTPGEYKKVVCIGAGALRLYCYIGDVANLAGVEDIDNSSLESRPKMFDGVARPYFIAYKEEFKTKKSCGVGGPQSQTIETEKILNCDPDLVISEYEDSDKANKLQSDLNVPVIVVSYGPNGVFDDKLHTSLLLIGEVLNLKAKAQTLVDFIKKEKADIENRTKDIDVSSQKKVYICGLGNWGTTNHLMTAQNYEPFNIAHINNVVTGLAKNGIQQIEAEKFESLAPSMDVIIMDAAAIKNIKKLYQDNPHLFDNCKAWQDGEVYVELAYNAYYTNLEIALCNTWFNAKTLYPDKFSDIDINTKLNEIAKAFLGKELADEINAYPFAYGKANKETIFS